MEIEQLDKPAQTWCRHCRPRHGCAIYQTRPIECVDFRCLWLSNVQLDDSWKPSRAKLVLTMSADITVDEGATAAILERGSSLLPKGII